MKVDLSSYIPCSYEEAVEQVKTPWLLQHVAFPLVSFTPFTPNCMPTFSTVTGRHDGGTWLRAGMLIQQVASSGGGSRTDSALTGKPPSMLKAFHRVPHMCSFTAEDRLI